MFAVVIDPLLFYVAAVFRASINDLIARKIPEHLLVFGHALFDEAVGAPDIINHTVLIVEDIDLALVHENNYNTVSRDFTRLSWGLVRMESQNNLNLNC